MYTEREINLQDAGMHQRLMDFLAGFELTFSGNIDYSMGIFDGDRLIATGSLSGRVLRNIAIDPEYQGQGLTHRILDHLMTEAKRRGITSYQIFTKPEKVPVFEHSGFTCVAKAEPYAALLEYGDDTLAEFLEKTKKIVGEPAGPVRGSIVMNCNPFTKGHRALIEYTSQQCDDVVLFAVQEDRSMFPFADRLELIRKGTADLGNVKVVSGGDYIISNATFPTYFIKGTEALDAQTKLDATVFAEKIAPALGITVRFVGEEPTDNTTSAYNSALGKVLPMNDMDFKIIPRIQKSGTIVSASKVRAALANDDWQTVEAMVPKTTLDYLHSERGAAVIEKIKKDAAAKAKLAK
ncbi:[citrate (pro-3S)-lyase] ligase [Negativicoccus succinicivorans]|uniref:[citrate (pro-3S)-lyase] ligase n=1 Tax=Negativicoccus succinicivorans TaxID=620903 RepID=UPI002900110C|nr:[citrate (pro-3S)-lyase] ligase [Negativicoccus succinicivorans]MDU2417843.1 [citrate (pro-3S)-lyase] ligase [Negativicoccus succinicivorans]